MTLTAERLREVSDYNPKTGIFTWKIKRSGVKWGQAAGTLNGAGYQQISVDGKIYLAHRLAWLFIHGSFPESMLDHANGVRDDNRIANLRECSQSWNQQNRSLSGSGATGYLGVCFNKQARKFQAHITSRGVRTHLGLFDTAAQAYQAYLEAKQTIHQFQGFDRRTGFEIT